MDILGTPIAPPRPRTAQGETRRVGVEVEFAAVTAREGAKIVQQLFGGTIHEEDAHRFHVEGTEHGDFTCELDTQYAHKPKDAEQGTREAMAGFRTEMRRLFGDVSSLVMPCEIVCPPIPWDRLPALDEMVRALNAAGAEGTRASPFYAFGVQLNPEIATDDPVWIGDVLRAYLMASPWLRGAMALDLTRRTVSFADPFPTDWVSRLVTGGAPETMSGLIDTYLDANPTRNRELDMLPLFAHLDQARLSAVVDDPRVKPRPAFHYRLPDANLGAPDWSICLEWNRWCVVERLADDPGRRAAMAADWQAWEAGSGLKDWPLRFSQWMIL